MPVMNKVCCVTLDKATKCIGWLGCIFFIWAMASTIYSLIMGYEETLIKMDTLKAVTSAIVNIVCHVFIIRAAHTQNRSLLMPWLTLTLIGMVWLNISLLYLLITFGEELVLILTILLVFDSIYIFLWLIVFSYYQELSEQLSELPQRQRQTIFDLKVEG